MKRSAVLAALAAPTFLLAACGGGGAGGPSDDDLRAALIEHGYSEELADCVAGKLVDVLEAEDLQAIVDGQDPSGLAEAIQATVECSVPGS